MNSIVANRYRVLAVCVGLAGAAGCGGQNVAPSSSPPQSAAALRVRIAPDHGNDPLNRLRGNLYVAGGSDLSGYPATSVERFRISHGVPESIPNRTYDGVGWPIALDATGDLYATTQPFGKPIISVYQRSSNKPTRTLNVWAGARKGKDCRPKRGATRCRPIGAFSLVVDDRGFLYVGFATGIPNRILPQTTAAVLIYAPGASGHDPPILTITVYHCYQCGAAVTGMTLDSKGDLLASLEVENNSGNIRSVLTYAMPTTNPTLVRTLAGTGIINPWGLATDPPDELYVDNPNGASSFIAAYPIAGSGSVSPDRTITVVGAQLFGFGIAAAANRLFAPNPIAKAVYELDARKDGVQTPIATLSVSATPLDVKLGP